MSAVTTTGRTSALGDLCGGALEFLSNALDERRGIFSYSARLVGDRFVNDFEHPLAVRYTINTLLGLREAARVDPRAPLAAEFPELLERFLDRQLPCVRSAADLGLLLALLADCGHERVAGDVLRQVEEIARTRLSSLNVQDVSWMLWGTTALVRAGWSGAEETAHRLAATLLDDFAGPPSALPRHTLARFRGHVVSFGSVTYFLRALHEYGLTLADERALERADRALQCVLAAQGPNGEWPWMLSVADARPLDVYPVFTVHQDSMAMLFLLPALDRGVRGTAKAARASFAWNVGENQLGRPLIVRRPFHIYRSLERHDRAPRARRYVRTLRAAHSADGAQLVPSERLRINREARSYHFGWILFAWAGRADEPSLETPL